MNLRVGARPNQCISRWDCPGRSAGQPGESSRATNPKVRRPRPQVQLMGQKRVSARCVMIRNARAY